MSGFIDVLGVASPQRDTWAVVTALIPNGYWRSSVLTVVLSALAMAFGIVLFRAALVWFQQFVK